MRKSAGILISVISVLLILGPSAALARQTTTRQQIALNMQGIITNAGSQAYEIDGGKLVSAELAGFPVPSNHAHLSYSLRANVTGLAASGTMSVELRAEEQDTDFGVRVLSLNGTM